MPYTDSDATFVEHLPCEECGSSDACGRYDDGHKYCFACEHWTPPDGVTLSTKDKPKLSKKLIQGGEYEALRTRKLTEETCKKFSYMVGTFQGKRAHIAEYRDRAGLVVAQHLRTADKDFPWIGDKKKATMFGQHLWKDGGKRVVVTEGEIDCMTVSQMQGHKWPVVSISSGAKAAKKDFQEQIDWLEKFEEVVIMFDMDEPGREAAAECALVLTPGKAKIAELPLKDPNEMLVAGRGSEIINAIWNAKTYRPDFLMSPEDMWDQASKQAVEGIPLCWPEVSKATYGIRLHEIWTLLAGSGMGKTEVFKELAYDFAMNQGIPCAVIFLEESPGHTGMTISGKHINKRLHKPDGGWTADEKRQAFNDVMKSGNILVHNHQGDSDFENIYRAIQYYVQAHGCQFIFLDHMTAMAEGKGEDNVNGRIHYIMEELNKLVQRLDVSLFLISHIRKTEGKPAEEGGRVKADDAYGSSAIKQRSNFIFALERDQQNDREGNKDINTFRCLKDRNLGEAAGKTFLLAYDHSTGRLLQHEGSSKPQKENYFAQQAEEEDVPF